MPVPMMAPIPSVTRLSGPRTRLSECSPVAAASAFSCSIDFVAKIDIDPPRAQESHHVRTPACIQRRELYLVSCGKPLQIRTYASFRIAGAQEIADHRD